MSIKVACGCGKVYAVPEEKAGRKLRCGKCQALIPVPRPMAPAKGRAESADSDGSDPFAGLPEVESAEERLPPRTVSRRTKSASSSNGTPAATSSPSLYGDSLEERMAARAEQSEPGHRRSRGIRYLASGVFVLALAALIFWYFSHLEEQGGFVRIHFVVAILYKLGGKWLAAVVVGGIGAVSCVLGFLNLFGYSVDVDSDD